MRRSGALPELLAPAGSYEAMLAAVAAGADAVYLGGRAFGARAYAQNFDIESLKDTVRYCHLHGVKVYVTVNTLLYDKELSEALAFCRELHDMGADAVISADLGLISLLRRYLPALPVHASTQMSVHNLAGAEAAADLGAERVVLARELSKEDIAYVTENARAEIEVFLHGALCVCHSGQCLFSSLVGGRSGNRGSCAQPCRLPYNGKDRYPLSLKDMSLSHHVQTLVEIGVSSLKIEGRMKSPSYVYGVTSVYRRLLDECRPSTAKEDKYLSDLFSRGGFTDGYFLGTYQKPMTGIRSEADKENTGSLEKQTFLPRKIPVTASVCIRTGEPAVLSLSGGEKTVRVTGDVPAPALNAPLSAEDLASRLCKMGNTYLSLQEKDVEVMLDEGLNLSPGSVNALRRRAVEAFCDTCRAPAPALPLLSFPTPHRNDGVFALFLNASVFRALSAEVKRAFTRVYLPLMFSDGRFEGALGVYLPPVIKGTEWGEVKEMLSRAKAAGVTHALVENVGQIAEVKALGLIPVGDFRLNICNGYTAEVYRTLGVSDYILSPELTLPMMRDVGGGAVTYGRIPLMVTERCFVKENGGCDKCGRFALTDRKGIKFPILREYAHRNLILNSLPTYMGDKKEDLKRFRVGSELLIFTTENAAEVTEVVRAYRRGVSLPCEVRRIRKEGV